MTTHSFFEVALKITQVVAWLVAFFWVYQAFGVLRGLPRVPDLLQLPNPPIAPAAPALTVIVPACNEASDIAACLESLLELDRPVIGCQLRESHRLGG